MKYDEMNQKRQCLLQDERKLAYHVKLYKAGKLWIVAGMTTAVLGIAVLMGTPVASAQTAPTSTAVTNTVPASTTVKDTASTNNVPAETSEAVKPAANGNSTSADQLKSSNPQQTASATTPAKTTAVNNGSSTVKSTSGNVATVTPKVTNLGNADSSQIAQAKATASAQYAQTGQPQVVTATSATTPKAAVTGQVTIQYLDKDTNQPIDFNSKNSSLPILKPTQINGSYIAQTTAPVADFGQLKVPTKVAQAEIAGYKFVGNDTTNLNFAPLGQAATPIKAYYEKLAPVYINYVNEDDPSDVLFQMEFEAQDTDGFIGGGAEYSFNLIPTFNGYTYDEQKTQATNALEGNGFKSLDETDQKPVILNVYYKKSASDSNPGPGALYIAHTVLNASDVADASDKTKSGVAYTHVVLTEAARTNPVNGDGTTMNGYGVLQYPNYTIVGTTGLNSDDRPDIAAWVDYIPNQPVEVVFLDDSTGQVIQQEPYTGATDGTDNGFDPENGKLPSGQYNTADVNTAVQPTLERKGYEFTNKVYGQSTGTYDAMHRIVYYIYTPKMDVNYVPVTRVINFTSSDGSVNMDPVTQTVWYKKQTNSVTGKSGYTPQNGYDQYVIPTIPGYSATISGQPATVVAQEGLPATTGMPNNERVTVNYDKLPTEYGGGTPGTPIEPSAPTTPTDVLGKVPTPPTNDGTTKVTTDNKVPTPPTGKSGKTTVTTGTNHGTAVSTNNGSRTQTGVATTISAAQGTQAGAATTVSAVQGSQQASVESSTTKSGQLPQTNEPHNGALSMLGVALMSMLGFLGIKKKRRD
ncbi:KxYKxGKxW signal peptide domain-containing protein [Secundilactobacillus yichangensis]|uniref:KxYKxGKxW signal peptide domain-containing protein n=1 Tax=Secundilactobacillus yichangensis TaxID=2799580 RepID=UPI00194221F3|nr:KxYKxGKxW signal peptide domain-containing protein [Secundilactobacillus yichangensis]